MSDAEVDRLINEFTEDDMYFLGTEVHGWKHVTKEEFVHAERSAGFYNTLGQPLEPATGGFSGHGVNGRIFNPKYNTPEQYHWDEEFEKIIRDCTFPLSKEQGETNE